MTGNEHEPGLRATERPRRGGSDSPGGVRSARLVVIGDEVLGGKIVDENTPWLLNRLRRAGVCCTGVAIVPDDVERIAAAVRWAADAADLVFTSGGVGPTHDDVTMEGVARAFGLPLVEDASLRALVNTWGGPLNSARLRMAMIPEGSDVLWTGEDGLPQVVVANVYVFPGVPRLLRSRYEAVEHLFRGDRPHCAALYTMQREGELAASMEQVLSEQPGIALGSYPRFGDADYRVRITVEAPVRALVDAALGRLIELLEPAALVRVEHHHHPEDDFEGC